MKIGSLIGLVFGIYLLTQMGAFRFLTDGDRSQLQRVQIGSRELWAEFDRNEVAAKQKYENVLLVVSGTVHSISFGLFENDLLVSIIESPSISSDVIVDCESNQRNNIARLTIGQKIKVSGLYDEFSFSTVYLRKGQIVADHAESRADLSPALKPSEASDSSSLKTR